jgi:hypothetical protein
MERIGRPGDDFRELLTRSDIDRICMRHDLPKPEKVVAEARGNENVAYHLDGSYFLAFGISEDTRRKVEVLRVFEYIPAMPTPKVMAWSERDPDLKVSYMILERCPGWRLDEVWDQCGHEDRQRLLDVIGGGMGKYHTTTLEQAKTAGHLAGCDEWVVDDTEARQQRYKTTRREVEKSLEFLDVRLRHWDLDGSELVNSLTEYFAGMPPLPDSWFIGPGLIHSEPFAEHFMVSHQDGAFELSGCVDLEECSIADSRDEIVSMYISMLGLDGDYLAAFRGGYERFFPFPPDAEEQLHAAAIDHDLGNILWLLDRMEQLPEWSFAKGWLTGHLERLGGWLGESKRPTRALFRKDIGPW